MTRQKRLTFFTAGYNQVSNVFPFLVVSPVYFAGRMALGGNDADGIGVLERADGAVVLRHLLPHHRGVARRGRPARRLRGGVRGRPRGGDDPAPHHGDATAGPGRRHDELEVRLPNGTPLVNVDGLRFPAGQNVLVNGPSGSESTLFRAIAGIWTVAGVAPTRTVT
jgi:vitamin B12/bleomycin/antimicrobial peptide transport system ATP-binding/permease protein